MWQELGVETQGRVGSGLKSELLAMRALGLGRGKISKNWEREGVAGCRVGVGAWL